MEWFYQLEGTNIHTWEDLAATFYIHYQYNTDLAPTRVQLQIMTMCSNEDFKEYTQKWRDLAGRVQPPLTDRELVDMFLGTLSGTFFNHLIGSSSVGFTELILTGERVEAGIKSGKIQRDASASATVKKSFSAKKEAAVIYSQKGLRRTERRPTVGAVMIQNSSNDQPRNNQSRPNQQRVERPQRQFTRINMTPAQVLPHLLKLNLTTIKEAPKNVNTSSPHYHPNAKCAYHSDSVGHDTNDCWALKNKIQDLIVLYPKICPPIFFKDLPSQASKFPKGCTVQGPPKQSKLGFWF